ncbi:MAG TPA: peroxiredoxin-like family protein [Deltaproteobacteria bacterium]|nr:peroxiredoxin-like family protein [Deltaproteobacteria bacterium]HPR52715.1 peroxiredoxin-like family protein [Deltaproteobacteria bacterium]
MTNSQMKVGDTAPDFKYITPWDNEKGFYESAGKKPAVLVFLRYLGCPICQIDMANLKREIDLVKKKGASLFVIIQSSPDTVASSTTKEDWPFTIICDPQRSIYQLYRVSPGNILKYIHPAGLIAAVAATFKGYRHGKFEGRETQLPAVFVVGGDKVLKFVHYGKHIADVPSTETFMKDLPA